MCVTEQTTATEFSPWNREQSSFPENADIWSLQSCETWCYVVGREFRHGCASSPTVRPWRWKHYGKYSSIDRALIFQRIWVFRTSKLTLTSVYQTIRHHIQQFLHLHFSLTLCSWYASLNKATNVSSLLVAKNQCAIRLHDEDFNRMLMWLQDESVEVASSQRPDTLWGVGTAVEE
jgi:hypothetical protein